MDTLSYEKMSMISQSFFGFIKDGMIYNNNSVLIGRTEEKYQQAIETAKKFEQKLIEAGIIQKPKTPEEINKELQEMIAEMAGTIATLSDKVKGLENEQAKSNEHSGTLHLSTKASSSKSSV